MKILNLNFPIAVGDKITYNDKMWDWYKTNFGANAMYQTLKDWASEDLIVLDIAKFQVSGNIIVHVQKKIWPQNNDSRWVFYLDKNGISTEIMWREFKHPFLVRVK